MTGEKLSSIWVANMDLIYWPVRSSRAGWMGVIYFLARWDYNLLGCIKIWCKIKVIIYRCIYSSFCDNPSIVVEFLIFFGYPLSERECKWERKRDGREWGCCKTHDYQKKGVMGQFSGLFLWVFLKNMWFLVKVITAEILPTCHYVIWLLRWSYDNAFMSIIELTYNAILITICVYLTW